MNERHFVDIVSSLRNFQFIYHEYNSLFLQALEQPNVNTRNVCNEHKYVAFWQQEITVSR